MKPDPAAYGRLDASALWHPYTRHSAARSGRLPLIVRGEGPYLFDAEGRRYFDAVASWWCCALGHSHPRLVEAIRRQAGELQHSILGNLSHPRAVELAARLAALFPDADRRVLFASDGASAVEAALKVAIQYRHNLGQPGRFRFASLGHAYHGDTLGAVSVGFLPGFHEPFRRVVFPVHRAGSPCCSTCPHGPDPGRCGLECFEPMRRIFASHGDELTAVIVEPLCQGAAGMRIYGPRYLRALADLCRERDVLLIHDEVAVGFGRTGRMFAFEHAGTDPDIVCLGKALSGGCLPLSATVVKRRVFDTFADEPEDHTFCHGHTFAGNPVAAAAALAALAVYEEEDIAAQAARAGARMGARFEGLRGLPGVADVRWLGMIAAVEFGADARGGGAALAARVRERLLAGGVLARPLGPVLYFMPPLVTPDDVVAGAVDRLAAAVREG